MDEDNGRSTRVPVFGQRSENGALDVGIGTHRWLSSPSMELLLIRHAVPIRREVADGPADPELSEAGWKQARLLATYLDTESIDALYASPMQRAMQTATPLAESAGLPIRVVDDVAEYDRN
ncbi:MAG: hypothetical protein RL391_659, partial [Actinomycetota bacterium]